MGGRESGSQGRSIHPVTQPPGLHQLGQLGHSRQDSQSGRVLN